MLTIITLAVFLAGKELAAATARLLPGITLITTITLVVFLAGKELAGASDSKPAQRIASFLTVPIIPLLILFVLIVALRVIEILA